MPYGSKIRTSLFSFRHFIEEAPRQGPTTNDEDVSPVSPAGVPQQGSQTMDPRAPHSSLPSGTGRTDVPMAKRSRLRYLNNDDDDEQRRCPTFKSSNGQIICLEPADGIGNLVLPIDLLTSSLLYLDVGDLPSALAVCKDWGKALQSAEDELWLGLVRKHCPSVEEISKTCWNCRPRKNEAALVAVSAVLLPAVFLLRPRIGAFSSNAICC